jgi:asparagine synthase (glutamine-hydrolysing)
VSWLAQRGRHALRHAQLQARELIELGAEAALFRFWWELEWRTPLGAALEAGAASRYSVATESICSVKFFADARDVGEKLRDSIEPAALAELSCDVERAARGEIRCFGRWWGDFGVVPDWHRDPTTLRRASSEVHWAVALRRSGAVGDIKLLWELARFPHAFRVARASVLLPDLAAAAESTLNAHIQSFLQANPRPRGVHWASGQEIAFRVLAWVFASEVFAALNAATGRPASPWLSRLGPALSEAALHVEQHLSYADRAVTNNHALSESLFLRVAALLLPTHARAARWRERGRSMFARHLKKQFYADGGYIQQSHTYHRLALQLLLLARRVSALEGEWSPDVDTALGRSVDFLFAQQNPKDGRLPNYGPNDGALPFVLSTCDFADFRPTLQAASLASRGRRLYAPGPWDEEAAWWLGPGALVSPDEERSPQSGSYDVTGHHVLRGAEPTTFTVFRCGTARDRFGQLDMLNVDVWWRGDNILADPGSYLYNGPREWHDHFFRTASHNTLTVDGLDQGLHFRKFKVLFAPAARTLRFEPSESHIIATGEHDGFVSRAGVTHRRTVIQAFDELWVVVDWLIGRGSHCARLQWLSGVSAQTVASDTVLLTAAGGPLTLFVYGVRGARGEPERLPLEVVAGRESPPRGWLARYYGERAPVPSISADYESQLPFALVSVLGRSPEVRLERDAWCIRCPGGDLTFNLGEDSLQSIGAKARAPCTS